MVSYSQRNTNMHPCNTDLTSHVIEMRSSTPKLHELDLLEDGGKTVRLIDMVAAKWDRVAIRLHFETHEIERMRQDALFQTRAACQSMFGKWLEGKGRKPTTWATLITALQEAGLSKVASDLLIIVDAL